MAPIKSLCIGNPSSTNPPSKASLSKVTKEKYFSKRQLLMSFYMDENFVKDFSPYDNICYRLLRELFVEKPNPLYQRLAQIVYVNLKYEDIYITLRMCVTKINFIMEEFGVMCKVFRLWKNLQC